MRVSLELDADVIVVGAGLAGLCAALAVERAGMRCLVVEASDGVGGRVRTDEVEGFRLDRGFQVFLSSYPEARAQLDLEALQLRAFEPGARVRFDGQFYTLLDPWRRPAAVLDGALAKVGTLGDKIKVGAMRAELSKFARDGAGRDQLFSSERPERSVLEALRARGFSEGMIDRFFRAFLGGIMLDTSLSGSSRMMEFVFGMFATADASVPRLGMGEIPKQLAAKLRGVAPGASGLASVRLGARVREVRAANSPEPVRVMTDAGELRARRVIVSTPGVGGVGGVEAAGARRLGWRAATCVYFAGAGPTPRELLNTSGLAGRSPAGGRALLLLDGDNAGPATNVASMSSVSDAYAPEGQHLVSATYIGDWPGDDASLHDAMRRQLGGWMGECVRGWRVLKTYRIREALPDQSPPWYTRAQWPVHAGPGVLVAGDWCDTASIDGAMRSGRRAGEAAVASMTSGV
jgi:phytoene dehydrogenase-like protein